MQTVVNRKLAFGVEGSFYDNSPRRVDPYIVSAGKIGQAFTVNSTDPTKADLGGTGIFAGIAVSPKEYPLEDLTADLSFQAGAVGQMATMGRVLVKCPTGSAGITVGMEAVYDNTTGVIDGMTAGGTVPTGKTKIAGAKFVLVGASADELAVLQLG